MHRVAFVLAALLAATPALACSSFLVTRGASADGSVMITYTCDGEFHPRLERIAAADHQPGDVYEIRDWSGTVRATIPEVPHTYAVVGLMNEHQLTIGETTFDGRPELENPQGLLHYWVLMRLALMRARTAREAIQVMGDLVEQHGYRSTGESFSIADPKEAWIMEMIGPGPGGHGALWVARRVPDGYVSCHANCARIREFPLDDPENCLYAPQVIEFAKAHGYGGEVFRFADAYCPATPQKLRYTATRVWSMLRRSAPSQDWPVDYHRGVPGAEPYPLWVKPDHKLTVADVFAIMRDHYEGTPYDLTQGVDAGPYGSPVRPDPMGFEVDGAKYTWERPISTKKTGFSFVSQCRAWLPDAVGGLHWYGVDDTYTTCYVPLYCGIDAVPTAYATGTLQRFSWDSAWWIFNLVANYANLRYSDMIVDIVAVQAELETGFLRLQPAVEKAAVELTRTDPGAATRYLTDYSLRAGETVVARWRDLGESLITKYNDGYVNAEESGYPSAWLNTVTKLRPGQFALPAADSLATKLPY
jgi:dipeptidase